MSTVALPNRFIVGPRADWLFFIGSPVLALLLGIAISGTPMATEEVQLLGHRNTATDMFLGTFIFAHLFIVFFRSHGNAGIRALYPGRFWVVPMLLVGSMLASTWVYVCCSVLATWWDVYHSGQQTFGLGRIYDRKAGNDPHLGRNLDIGLNQLLYAGPILAGACLWDHLEDFSIFERVGSDFMTAVPWYVLSWSGMLTRAVLAAGALYLVWYLYSYWRLWQQGYRVSWQKVALLVSTGTVSIWTWGFNSFGEAFFIMNFFHALQYFALVWKMESKTITGLFRVARPLALGAFVAVAFAFGAWAELVPSSNRLAVSVITAVALLHFWYDGFIWSVRKGQVT
jgi:hypothetical protein